MTPKASLTLEIIHKLGLPLMRSAIDSQPAGKELSDQELATLLAGMLSKMTDLSALIESKAPLDELRRDNAKAAIASVSAQVIAGSLHKTGRLPEGNALKRLYDSLDSVITFSENFTPDDEALKRLKALDPDGAYDSGQAHIQYISAMTPVIEALAGFSYGQPIQKFFVDLSGKIKERALGIQKYVGLQVNYVSFPLLRALADLYATCHSAETARLLSLAPEEQAREAQNKEASVKRIWENFDKRVAMIEALCQAIAGVSSGGSSVQPDQLAETPKEEAVVQPPPAPQQPAAPVQSEAPAQPQNPSHKQTSQASNPLSFFSKKPAGQQDQQAPASSGAGPEQMQETQTSPPAAPPQQPPAQEAQKTEAATPPAQSSDQDKTEGGDDDTGKQQQGGSGDSSNPMSFFKKS